MSAVPTCATCRYLDKIIAREVRKNERRYRLSLPVDLTEIERAKADKTACAAAGHHDAHARPDRPMGERMNLFSLFAGWWRRRPFCFTCDRHTLVDHRRHRPLGHVLREEWRRG